jgi:hypothetical protein
MYQHRVEEWTWHDIRRGEKWINSLYSVAVDDFDDSAAFITWRGEISLSMWLRYQSKILQCVELLQIKLVLVFLLNIIVNQKFTMCFGALLMILQALGYFLFS